MIRLITRTKVASEADAFKFTFHIMIRLITSASNALLNSSVPFTFHIMIRLITIVLVLLTGKPS